jgi:MipA family protein
MILITKNKKARWFSDVCCNFEKCQMFWQLNRSIWMGSILWLTTCFHATHADPDSETKLMDGYLGAGVMSYPVYDGSTHNQIVALPLIFAEYRGIFYIDLLRAGVRIWHNDAKTFAAGISAEPRFGFHATDNVRLMSMATRRDLLEGGPTLEWELPVVSISIAYYHDWTSITDGYSVRFSAYHQLWDNTLWDIGSYIDIDHADSRTISYYYGIRPNEATQSRPAYKPDGTTNYALGVTGAYKFNHTYALLFGWEANILGAEAANSPIVQRRVGITTYIGFGLIY